MKVTVTGATGTIGSALVAELAGRGDEVTALSRNPESAARRLAATADRQAAAGAGPRRAAGIQTLAWANPKLALPPLDALRGRDGVVHLLGEPIAQRWTDEAKREIRESRILSTRNLVTALGELTPEERPRVLVSQSGVGWYGPQGATPMDESQPAGSSFEADLTVAWEAEARKAEPLGVRVVLTRTGVVLSKSGGALEKMLPFFKLGVGGPVAGGGQYLSWVHLDDVAGALAFALDTNAVDGPVNVTAPAPTTNAQFSKALGRVLKRPAFLPVPAFAIKALYGEMAVIVTSGANVVPKRLQELGYAFRQPELEPALRSATS
jgi:uncharacterized protein (TIGR01777 family)